MTEQERNLFSEILDLNWEYVHETDWSNKWELAKTLSRKKSELKELMGLKSYNEFMETGRKMFAPKEETEEMEEMEETED